MIGSAASSGSTMASAVIAARPRPPPQLVLLEPPQLVLGRLAMAEPPQLGLLRPPQLVLDEPPQLVLRAKAARPPKAPATDIGRPPLSERRPPLGHRQSGLGRGLAAPLSQSPRDRMAGSGVNAPRVCNCWLGRQSRKVIVPGGFPLQSPLGPFLSRPADYVV